MSGSWLYQAFGVRGYEYVSTSFEQGKMIVRVSQRRESLRCSAFGAEHVHVKSHLTRRFRTLPVGHKAVWLELPIAKVWCQECLTTRQVEVTFAKPKKHYTKTFARFVVELSGFMTPMDIACFLGISWDTARDILKEHLGKKYGQPKLRRVKHIAIDEVYLGKRHKFITLVLDLDSGAVIFVGEGKSAEALRLFWPRLRASHAQIEAVATDLSAAYISAVMQNLKGSRAGLRSFPHHQTDERKADATSSRTVSRSHDQAPTRSAQRDALVATEQSRKPRSLQTRTFPLESRAGPQ